PSPLVHEMPYAGSADEAQTADLQYSGTQSAPGHYQPRSRGCRSFPSTRLGVHPPDPRYGPFASPGSSKISHHGPDRIYKVPDVEYPLPSIPASRPRLSRPRNAALNWTAVISNTPPPNPQQLRIPSGLRCRTSTRQQHAQRSSNSELDARP